MRTILHIPLFLLFCIVFITTVYSADNSSLKTTIHISDWENDKQSVIQSAKKNGIHLSPLPGEKLDEYDNYILKYLLSIDSDARDNIEVLFAKEGATFRDFVLYKGTLCAVSHRNEPCSASLYQQNFVLLKKKFGPPETKRTEATVTHTLQNSHTTVLFMVKSSGNSIATRTYLYPTDLFKRVLFPLK